MCMVVGIILDFPHIEAEFATQEEVYYRNIKWVLLTPLYIDLLLIYYSDIFGNLYTSFAILS
jgi:hypothetical protein